MMVGEVKTKLMKPTYRKTNPEDWEEVDRYYKHLECKFKKEKITDVERELITHFNWLIQKRKNPLLGYRLLQKMLLTDSRYFVASSIAHYYRTQEENDLALEFYSIMTDENNWTKESLPPMVEVVMALTREIEIYLRLGEEEKALEKIEQILKNDHPICKVTGKNFLDYDQALAIYYLATIYFSNNKYLKCLQLLDKMRAKLKKEQARLTDKGKRKYVKLGSKANILAAKCYGKQRNYKKAREMLEVLAKSYFKSISLEARLTLGKLAREEEKYDLAIGLFEDLMREKVYEDNVDEKELIRKYKDIASLEIGNIYLQQNDFEEARQVYYSLLSTKEKEEAYLKLAELERIVGNFAEALLILKRVESSTSREVRERAIVLAVTTLIHQENYIGGYELVKRIPESKTGKYRYLNEVRDFLKVKVEGEECEERIKAWALERATKNREDVARDMMKSTKTKRFLVPKKENLVEEENLRKFDQKVKMERCLQIYDLCEEKIKQKDPYYYDIWKKYVIDLDEELGEIGLVGREDEMKGTSMVCVSTCEGVIQRIVPTLKKQSLAKVTNYKRGLSLSNN